MHSWLDTESIVHIGSTALRAQRRLFQASSHYSSEGPFFARSTLLSYLDRGGPSLFLPKMNQTATVSHQVKCQSTKTIKVSADDLLLVACGESLSDD